MAIYSDLHTNMLKHPYTDDVVVRQDVLAVREALKNLIMTKKYEKPFDPNFGSDITNMLFELWSPDLKTFFERKIKELVDEYEPRVRLDKVEIVDSSDQNAIELNLEFYVIGINRFDKTTISFERIK